MSATDEQMQRYADERIRRRAEQLRAVFASMRDDRAALGEVYDRADGGDPWADDRTDGPPKLLLSQDVLVYNTIIFNLVKVLDGVEEGTEQQIANQRAAYVAEVRNNWAQFMQACVQPIVG